MKPLKDYVEIIFAVLALAVLVFYCGGSGETCGAVRDVCDGSGGGSSSPERECHRDLKDT